MTITMDIKMKLAECADMLRNGGCDVSLCYATGPSSTVVVDILVIYACPFSGRFERFVMAQQFEQPTEVLEWFERFTKVRPYCLVKIERSA